MAVTLGSTGITFPDATTQTTAATVGGVTSIVAGTGITTSGTTAVTVNVATALGAVGTYALLYWVTSSSITPGSTYAASGLYWGGVAGDACCAAYIKLNTGQPASGTWRAMGGSSNRTALTVFQRIA